jgi:hypothetical protein
MFITMDAKRRLTIPTSAKNFKPGDTFEAHFDPEENEIVFRKINQDENWVEVMMRCPVPMDDLPPRSREIPKELDL